jgi:hypothetical protein
LPARSLQTAGLIRRNLATAVRFGREDGARASRSGDLAPTAARNDAVTARLINMSEEVKTKFCVLIALPVAAVAVLIIYNPFWYQ